jgi:ABC-type bacteriocin/lantibiotic exporter with double-glycine peptidase domain
LTTRKNPLLWRGFDPLEVFLKKAPSPLALCLLLTGLLTFGCASSGKLQQEGTFSPKSTLLEVPFIRQSNPTLCGPATAEMLTLYYGKRLATDRIKALKKEADLGKGIKGSSLEAALKGSGYHTAIFVGALDKKPKGLYHHLDKRRPLIVMLSPEGGQENHYLLVAGYDPKNGLIALLDPAKGPLAMPVASFKASWERANSFTLLAVPGEGPAPR